MRTETTTRTLYTFDELREDAKEKARDRWREWVSQDFDGEFVIEDATRIADILGIDLDTRSVKLMNGTYRHDPLIHWSGFSSQGDGASFEGTYRYKKGAAKAIREYAPQDSELHGIADRLQAIQARHLYSIRARISTSGRYCHEYTMSADCTSLLDDRAIDDRTTDDTLDEMRDFARWIYRRLRDEYEYTLSDEAIDAEIEVNEREFTEDGTLA